MFLLNSCLGLFSAATSLWHPFSRSYGVILPSSLTTLLPPAFEFSSHLPVSVCGTGMHDTIAAFLDSLDSDASLLNFSPRHVSVHFDGFAYRSTFALAPVFPFPAHLILLCPHSSDHTWYWNICQLSIDYGSRPRLRSRLPQSRSP